MYSDGDNAMPMVLHKKCQHGSTLTDAHERTTVAGEFILFVVRTDMTSLDVTRAGLGSIPSIITMHG